MLRCLLKIRQTSCGVFLRVLFVHPLDRLGLGIGQVPLCSASFTTSKRWASVMSVRQNITLCSSLQHT